MEWIPLYVGHVIVGMTDGAPYCLVTLGQTDRPIDTSGQDELLLCRYGGYHSKVGFANLFDLLSFGRERKDNTRFVTAYQDIVW